MNEGRGRMSHQCSECGSIAALVNNSAIYGRPYGAWPYAWQCQNPKCRASVGTHPGTDTPLGTFANRRTRQARRAAHAAFDPLWQSGTMKRREAYRWLAEQLGLTAEECHIGRFTLEQCAEVVAIVRDVATKEGTLR